MFQYVALKFMEYSIYFTSYYIFIDRSVEAEKVLNSTQTVP